MAPLRLVAGALLRALALALALRAAAAAEPAAGAPNCSTLPVAWLRSANLSALFPWMEAAISSGADDHCHQARRRHELQLASLRPPATSNPRRPAQSEIRVRLGVRPQTSGFDAAVTQSLNWLTFRSSDADDDAEERRHRALVANLTRAPDAQPEQPEQPEPDDELEPLRSHLEPRWMDSCNIRRIKHYNAHSAINLFVAPTKFQRLAGQAEPALGQPLHRPNGTLDVERNPELARHLKLIRGAQSKQAAPPSSSRERRSTTGAWDSAGASTVLFGDKQPVKWSKHKWLRAKKTSFSMSKLSHLGAKHSQRANTYRRPQGPAPAGGKGSRFYYTQMPTFGSLEPPSGAPAAAAASTSTAPTPSLEPARQEAEQQLARDTLESLYKIDLRLSWALGGMVSVLNDAMRLSSQIVDRTLGAADALADQRAQLIRSDATKWLPKLDQLISGPGKHPIEDFGGAPKLVGGLHEPRTRLLLCNLTHYFEFFSVAFEQMAYEGRVQKQRQRQQQRQQQQQLASRNHNSTLASSSKMQTTIAPANGPSDASANCSALFIQLEDVSNQIVCQLNLLTDELNTYNSNRAQLNQMSARIRRSALDGFETYFDKITGGRDRRDRKLAIESFESPLVRAYDELVRTNRTNLIIKYKIYGVISTSPTITDPKKSLDDDQETGKTVPEHIWRHIMPREQRNLATGEERAYRNRLILQDYIRLVKCYQSLLLFNTER